MRNTKQKSLILDIINQSFQHPTAYMVHEECLKIMPNISLGTVYRNLNKLVEQNKIQRLEVPGDFERYDKTLAHDHFICLNCSKIIDLDSQGYVIASENCHTNVDGIFVAGDNRVKKVRQLVTAEVDGAVAALEAVNYINK